MIQCTVPLTFFQERVPELAKVPEKMRIEILLLVLNTLRLQTYNEINSTVIRFANRWRQEFSAAYTQTLVDLVGKLQPDVAAALGDLFTEPLGNFSFHTLSKDLIQLTYSEQW